MGHEELKEIGINAYGHRHKLIKGIERLLGGQQGQRSHPGPGGTRQDRPNQMESIYLSAAARQLIRSREAKYDKRTDERPKR